ncbi:MAG: 3-hydroxyacyl-ACP dehydratase [Bacteroidetes bacterium]|nr:MAG: 3-hydroxyacyl-ACP dehydratase [Bacteroidota bacterium]
MEIEKIDIRSLIPQRDPFVMIDHLSHTDERSGCSELQIRKENIFLSDDFLTEPGLIENIAQTAAARIGYICQKEKRPVPVGYIGAVQNLAIYALPRIHDRLMTEISIKNEIFHVSIITGRIRCNEQLIAECEMKIFISNQS